MVWRLLLPLALGGAGALALVLRRKSEQAPSSAKVATAPKTFTSDERFRPLRMTAKSQVFRDVVELRAPQVTTGAAAWYVTQLDYIVQLFGVDTESEYPAPYRYRDALAMAQMVMGWAGETSGSYPIVALQKMRMRLRTIEGSDLPNWRKTYAIIFTVIIPTYAANMVWSWYRPQSQTKEQQFNGVINWASMFLTMPTTATVPASGAPLLPGMSAYLNPGTKLRRRATPRQARRSIMAVYDYIMWWPSVNARSDGAFTLAVEDAMEIANRMPDLEAVYPASDPSLAWVMQGNMKAVDEIGAVVNARVQSSVAAFDIDAWVTRTVIGTVAAIISTAIPSIGGGIGQAISVAADAAMMIARAATGSEVGAADVQALAGVGVTMVLNESGIRLSGLPDEIARARKAANAARAAL